MRRTPSSRGNQGDHRARASARKPRPERRALRETARRFVEAEVLPGLVEVTLRWCRLRETFGHPLISRQAVQHRRHCRDVRILGLGGGSTEILTGLAAKRRGYTG